jgi:multifunctional methyltransferase subunit TRM112
LNWQSVLVAANAVGLGGFPDALTPDLMDSEEFLKAVHQLLLDMHVMEGFLICPDTGHRFPITDGIPCFM